MISNISTSYLKFKNIFKFLETEYGFQIIHDVHRSLGFFIIYRNSFVKLGFSYDFRDNYFTFDLINGSDTVYPDEDNSNIIDADTLYEKLDIKEFKVSNLHPNNFDFLGCFESIAKMLKIYCPLILNGKRNIN